MMQGRLLMAACLVAGTGFWTQATKADDIATIEGQASGTTVTLDSTSTRHPIVTAILSQPGTFNGRTYTSWSFTVNDGTGSLVVFGSIPAGYTPTVGDEITVAGTWSPYHQLPEVGTVTAITRVSQNNPVPPPLVKTIPDVNLTTLPMSIAGYIVTLNGVSVSGASGNFGTSNIQATITDGSSNSMTLYYWPTSYSTCNANLNGQPVPTWSVNMTGFISVYPGGATEFTPISFVSVPGSFAVAGAASPNPAVAGTTVTFNASVNPGTNPPSTGITVTANLSSIGGPSSAAFTADTPLPDGTVPFTYTMSMPCTASTGDLSLPLHAVDAQLRNADTTIPLTVNSGAPGITVQPSDNVVTAGGTAHFSVVATGANLTYLWYNTSGPLSDAGKISGSTAPTLTITGVDAGDVATGPYHVVVTASCPTAGTTLASDSAKLTLGTAATDEQKQIVISQVYGGGGNAGATLKNDFIELFNKGTAPVMLAQDWSVQYASNDMLSATTADTGPDPSFGTPVRMTVIPAGTTIQPGHYYLIKEAYGAAGTQDLPTPDLDAPAQGTQYTILLGYNGGKVALVNHSTPLTGACPLSDNNGTIIDFLGWDDWTLCHEGSASAPYTTNTTSVFRKSACVDTNDNFADFTYGTPVPHNSGSATAPTILTQPTDQSACVGQTVTFTVVADGPCLTYHWQVYINGAWTNVTDGSGDGTPAYTTPAIAGFGTQYHVVLSSPFGPSVTSNTVKVTDGTPTAEDKQVVINQIYGGGGNANAPYQSDFVELYNRGPTAVHLDGWSLEYASAGGSSWTNTTALSGVILPGHYFLIQEATGSSCSGQPCGNPFPVTPDLIDPTPIALSATAGKVALLKTTAVLGAVTCPSDGDCRVVDFVGYGSTANCSEGSPAPAPSNTKAIVRSSPGHDTDNNAADFVVADPQVSHFVVVDYDHDGHVTSADLDLFNLCFSGPAVPYPAGCQDKDLDADNDVDEADFAIFQKCYTGSTAPADPNCLTAP